MKVHVIALLFWSSVIFSGYSAAAPIGLNDVSADAKVLLFADQADRIRAVDIEEGVELGDNRVTSVWSNYRAAPRSIGQRRYDADFRRFSYNTELAGDLWSRTRSTKSLLSGVLGSGVLKVTEPSSLALIVLCVMGLISRRVLKK